MNICIRLVRSLAWSLVFLSQAGGALAQQQDSLTWTGSKDLAISGQGWINLEHPFDRLPRYAQALVREPVWSLAQNSAGISIAFRTNATSVHVRWTLRFDNHMNHMADTGIKGLDLYVRNGDQWLWAGVGRPSGAKNEVALLKGLPEEMRDYLIYLPLYDGIDSISIGVPQGSTVQTSQPWSGKPLVFYGTSITQGGCASRTGMAYPAIIGRKLGLETINLGFSGNGRMEIEMAEILASLDAKAFVIDCLPNMTPEMVTERVVPFVSLLKKRRPETPVILVESIYYEDSWFLESRFQQVREKNQRLKEAFQTIKEQGANDLFFLSSEGLLGNDHEATVDGVHLTDLGFLRYAQGFVEFWTEEINR